MKKVNLIPGSKKKLMKDPKFRAAYMKLSGKFNRQRNRLRRKLIIKIYWR